MDELMSPRDRSAAGRASRAQSPRRSHADWTRPDTHADPVAAVTAGDAARVPWLLAERHTRMAESPFAFHQAAAGLMAADLASTPTSGIEVQLVGDAHLANFGAYTAPDSSLAFGVDEVDQTAPGPWEWDVKRLAASVVVTARHNGFPGHAAAEARAVIGTYRLTVAQLAEAPALQAWFARLAPEQIQRAQPSKGSRPTPPKARPKQGPTSQRPLGKLVEVVDGRPRLRSHPGLLLPARDLGEHEQAVRDLVEQALPGYRESLSPDRRRLLDRFAPLDIGISAAGVSAVAEPRFLVLLTDRDHGSTVVLQAGRVSASVLAEYLQAQVAPPVERVVTGVRLLEQDTDVFLGWSGRDDAEPLVWRQFRHLRGAADVAAMDPDRLAFHAGLCAWTLAHAHARSGDAVAIAGYLGKGRAFERSVTTFAQDYADQNERDYDTFRLAIEKGLVEVAST
jgi:hypothetical protein